MFKSFTLFGPAYLTTSTRLSNTLLGCIVLPYKLDYIRRVDTEEDVQDLGLFRPRTVQIQLRILSAHYQSTNYEV